MTPTDYAHRRIAAASAILAIIQREQPDAVRQLAAEINRVFDFEDGTTTVNEETTEAVAQWCAQMNLSCPAIWFEALTLGLTNKTSSPGPSSPIDDDAEIYRLPYVAGESKRAFLQRAVAEFDRMKNEHAKNRGIPATDRLNPKHVEWFVRFQVNGSGFDQIARFDQADRSAVKRAVREIAGLLGLPVRRSAPGRPKGRGKSRRAPHHIVRHRTAKPSHKLGRA